MGQSHFDPAILRLMAITDGLHTDGEALDAERLASRELVERVKAAVRGGATCVQVRLKSENARVIAEVSRAIVEAVDVPVLINDRFDIALAVGAAGVHLGADDISVKDARTVLPNGFIVGTSVGCDAEVANAKLADFVGIGPVFATGSKTDAGEAIGIDEFARLMRATNKPAIAIGGVSAAHIKPLMATGAAGVAVIGAIFGTPDPEAAARAISAQF